MNRFLKFQVLLLAFISGSTFAQYSYNPEHLMDKGLTKYKTLEEVLKIINSYPNEFEIKNSLGIIYDSKAVYGKKTIAPNIFDVIGRDEEVFEGYKEVKSEYKNIGNRPIIVKGLGYNYYPSTNSLTYVNLSFRLEPGETEYYPIIGSINSKFNPEIIHEKSQFWGNVGTIKEINKKENEENEKNEKKETVISNTFANRIGSDKIQVNSVLNYTDIKIKNGDKINLNVSGRVTLGVWVGSTGPEGVEDYTDYNIVPNFKHGCLLIRLTDKDQWTPVGNSASFVAQGNGTLQFIVNDRDPSNNSGSFTIEYGINKTITPAPTKPTVTPAKTQSFEQTYTQPVTEPEKTSTPPMTDVELKRIQDYVKKLKESDDQLESDLFHTNRMLFSNEMVLSIYNNKRKTKKYWKYIDDRQKLRTEKEQIENKYKEKRALIENEFKNKNSTNLNAKSNSVDRTPIISNVKTTLIRTYTGTMTNTTYKLKGNCDMTFSKNSDGTFQLKGETDKVNLVGKWDLKGNLVENNIYHFKGDIVFGYEGTNYPLGTTTPISITLTISERDMIGNYTISTNNKDIDKQEGKFMLRKFY